MAAHNEHVERLERKFVDVWYFQGRLPRGAVPKVDLASVYRFLDGLAPRRAGVLFYASSAGKLCAWLLTPSSRR